MQYNEGLQCHREFGTPVNMAPSSKIPLGKLLPFREIGNPPFPEGITSHELKLPVFISFKVVALYIILHNVI